MQLTLVVPGLLTVVASAGADLASVALARVLATSPRPTLHDSAIGVTCAALGIAKQRDWPVAPILALAAGLDPGEAYWLLAEPVTLLIGQQDARLAAVVDDLSTDQAAAILTTLNAHFAGDGLRLHTAGPARWLIAAASVPQLSTHLTDDALGEPTSAFLPDGPDAARWRRWQSEMQMLLFAHPVTSQREREGRAPVNAIWLSGGGVRAVDQTKPRIASMHADAPLPRDLARGCGVTVAPAPSSFLAWLEAGPKSPSMVWLDAIAANDAAAALAAFDRNWAAPLCAAIDARTIDEITIVISGHGHAWSFAPRRRSLIGRWRDRLAPAKLSTLLAGVEADWI
jgi:hypothetical protein